METLEKPMQSDAIDPCSKPKKPNLKIPKSRVELHLHITGSVRLSTVYELSKKKKLPLPGRGTFEELLDAVVVKEPGDLAGFLDRFKWLKPAIEGDTNALERVAYELCEDQAKNGVIYFEGKINPLGSSGGKLKPDTVIQAFITGLTRGLKDFGVQSRMLFSCIIGKEANCSKVLDLCDKYRNKVCVGIDIAGDEAQYGSGTNIRIPKEFIQTFQEAKKRGIHRTMHAGEAGSYAVVEQGINVLHVERIGHGYHVVDNDKVYREAIAKDIHFEMCPYSSLKTGAVSSSASPHPIVRLAEDGANFSISTDDPSITGTYMNDEFELVAEWGFTEAYQTQAAFNAARSCFLPENEKQDLIRQLKKTYGVPE